MNMTNEEIVRSYKQAKAQKAQIGILADLNACKREEIIRILMESGIPEKELRRTDWKPKTKTKKESPDKEAPKEAVADDASEDEESTVVTQLKEKKWKLELKRADLDMQIDALDVVIGMMEEV